MHPSGLVPDTQNRHTPAGNNAACTSAQLRRDFKILVAMLVVNPTSEHAFTKSQKTPPAITFEKPPGADNKNNSSSSSQPNKLNSSVVQLGTKRTFEQVRTTTAGPTSFSFSSDVGMSCFSLIWMIQHFPAANTKLHPSAECCHLHCRRAGIFNKVSTKGLAGRISQRFQLCSGNVEQHKTA